MPAADGYGCGVLFRWPASALGDLDAIEGHGYARLAVRPVGLDSGDGYRAWCYRASARARVAGLVPFDWYRALVIEGARNHRLPDAYVEALRCVPARDDPNHFRRRRGQSILGYSGKPIFAGRHAFVPGPKSGWRIDGQYRDRYHAVAPHIAL